MNTVTVSIVVNAELGKVWEYWNEPRHISNWAFASEDWGAEGLESTLEVGGNFKTRMFAKDGSASFDFEGTYTKVEPQTCIEYVMSDGRKVSITFTETDAGVEIVETFDPETENPLEMQRSGWQAFLGNFKSYVEST